MKKNYHINKFCRADIKPLSVNDCWRGRRFKTPDYKGYELMLMFTLPIDIVIPDGDLCIYLEFGMSSKASDWDNPIKPFVDILQKKYHFNDNRICAATVIKFHVPKGEEYITWRIGKHKEGASCQI